MQKAIDQLRALWDAGYHPAALKLAAGWPRLGEHKNAIQMGWAAFSNPGMYRQLGKDPDALLDAGLDALEERYNLPPRNPTNE